MGRRGITCERCGRDFLDEPHHRWVRVKIEDYDPDANKWGDWGCLLICPACAPGPIVRIAMALVLALKNRG